MKNTIIIILVAIVIIGFGVVLFKYGNNQPGSANVLAQAPNDFDLKTNLQKAGLDQLPAEGTLLHIHQHLDVVVNDQYLTIPAGVGIGTTFISPIHTHDISGVLHVESPVVKDFKLAQFFDEWGVQFNDNCVANYCTDANNKF